MLNDFRVAGSVTACAKRKTLLLSLTFFVGFPAAALAYPSCDQAPKVSPNSSLPITMTFRNISNEPLRLDWVDFNGQLKNYGTVGPGQSKTQPTFQGHVWQWTRPPGTCINRYVAGQQNVQ